MTDINRRAVLVGAAALVAGAASAGCGTPRQAAAATLGAQPHYATLLDAAAAIKSRAISPVELTRLLLDRIERLQPSLHAYVTVTEELALAQAATAEREIAAGSHRGPLHGVPIAVKDLCWTKGVVTTAGMSIYADYRPADDATVVKRLAEAGAVLLGKLQLPEGASGEHLGAAPVNPWRADHTAGASSSGSGVATAAGLCFGSLGTDTTGSIRYPAAANGLTGLKPTWGRVSRHGVFPLAESLDHVGPMTRSAADAGAILGAIAGSDPNDPTALLAPVPDYLASLGPRLDGVRVGFDSAYNEAGADPETVAMVREARSALERLGARIVEVAFPDAAELIATGLAACAAEAALAHEATYPSRASEYGKLAALLDLGRAATGVEVQRSHRARRAFTGRLAELFAGIDLLLTPSQPPTNLTIERSDQIWASAEGIALMWRFTEPFNMSGSPTITLPGGFTADGMPLTFQLVARHLDEAHRTCAGHAYQQATDWHHRHPPI